MNHEKHETHEKGFGPACLNFVDFVDFVVVQLNAQTH
jgi:hypothetical protein